MKTEDILLLAVTLIILAEVTFLLTKLPKTRLNAKDRAVLIDTSVLMDGRIISIATSGFIGGTLVIPRSVVGELQLLADGSDSDKRSRARYGLDVVTDLQKLEGIHVELLQDGSRAKEGVDERLLTLAKQHTASICTLDFNLNKVAAVEGIQVLNINELAQGLRMSHLPGDHVMIELVQKGQDAHQAVGYLPDGTMVVVEQSSAHIGKTVTVEVIRSLQTAAGKMMFARRLDASKKQSATPTGRRAQAASALITHTKPQRAVVNTPPAQDSLDTKRVTPSRTAYSQRQSTQTSASSQTVSSAQQQRPKGSSFEAKQPTVRAQTKTQSAGSSSATTPRRRNTRRPDREAALIALVNKQD